MPAIYRILFPACASFGPMFMVIGLQGRSDVRFVSAASGALMTSAALLMLFDRMVDDARTVTPGQRRLQLLYWSAVIVIGVLIWLLTS